MKLAPPGPYLIRRAEPSAFHRKFTVLIALRDRWRSRTLRHGKSLNLSRSRFRRPSLPDWKIASLSAAAGVLLTFAVVVFLDHRTAPVEPVTTPHVVVIAPPVEHPVSSASPDQKLIDRNRRLEALVQVLKERRRPASSRRHSAK